MPELPEVETIVRGLRKKIIGKRIKDFWTDTKKLVKKPNSFKKFQKELRGRKIKNIRRRGKNILIDLSGDKVLLVHQKMTGHLLVGKWSFKKGEWFSEVLGPLLDDPRNRFLHLIFFLDDGRQLALSDLRKFAKIEFWDRKELEGFLGFKSLGPEPLDVKFTLKEFKKVLEKRKSGKIKQVLMDQKIIAGIGNIYSDEILWRAKVNPLKDINELNRQELKKIFWAIKFILKKGIELKGDSISDFRGADGTKGSFDKWSKVYKREGKKCKRCKAVIKRKKIGGRSAHFCPKCQK
jgi:formamidopyrimidine-DNA glycosylase